MKRLQILAAAAALLLALSDASLAAQKRQPRQHARAVDAYGAVNPQNGGAVLQRGPAANQLPNRPYPHGPYPDRPYGDPGRW